MVIYIDRNEIKDPENISNEVFKYILEKSKDKKARFEKLYNEYIGASNSENRENSDEIKVNINYGKYIVDITRAFYLGDPVKYDNNEKSEKKTPYTKGKEVSIDKKGRLIVHDWNKLGKEQKIDISPIIDAYDNQTIIKTDGKIGKYIGIFGEAQELLYASDDEIPLPKSAVYLPQDCILVQDNSIEHRNIFFLTVDIGEKLNRQKYYILTVYTDKTVKTYRSTDLNTYTFTTEPEEEKEHFFGDVPCVNYENDDERQGDLEQLITLSHAYSGLMSDRLTDKHKFVDAILAFFGFSADNDNLSEDDSSDVPESKESFARELKKNKFIDGLPTDARIEYIQKTFDESSVKILADDLVRDMHKMSMTVDLSDEKFSGNITGVALEMKFMCMVFLAKNKILNMTEGLKRRFSLYNNWLMKKNAMPFVSRNDIDVVFTINTPRNLSEVVDMVCKLENRVDEQTLLAQLSFVSDPKEMVELVKKQKDENQKNFLDSFGNKEPGGTEKPEKEGEEV